jgi:5-methylcytosine-specific restriction endonuclease McrA
LTPLTEEVLKNDKKPVFMSDLGMVKRISKKLVLKYSSKEAVKPHIRGLRALHKQNRQCYYCGCITSLPNDNAPQKKDTATIDHKTPRRRGGANSAENEVLCCHQCNGDKAHLTEGEYRAVLAYRQSQFTKTTESTNR